MSNYTEADMREATNRVGKRYAHLHQLLRVELQAAALEEAAEKIMGPSDVLLDAATCRWIAMELRENAAEMRAAS